MVKFLSFFNLLCLLWMYSREASARDYQDENPMLLEAIATLLDNHELSDLKAFHVKKQMSDNVADVQVGSEDTGSDIRNFDRHYIGDVSDADNGDIRATDDIYEDNTLLREIHAFLSSKRSRRRKPKRWLDKDGARGTSTTTTTPTTRTTAPESPATTTTTTKSTTTTTKAPVIRKCRVSWTCWWRKCYFYRPCR